MSLLDSNIVSKLNLTNPSDVYKCVDKIHLINQGIFSNIYDFFPIADKKTLEENINFIQRKNDNRVRLIKLFSKTYLLPTVHNDFWILILLTLKNTERLSFLDEIKNVVDENGNPDTILAKTKRSILIEQKNKEIMLEKIREQKNRFRKHSKI